MTGNATQDEQVRERVDNVDRLELAGDPNGQAFVGELVDGGFHRELGPRPGPTRRDGDHDMTQEQRSSE